MIRQKGSPESRGGKEAELGEGRQPDDTVERQQSLLTVVWGLHKGFLQGPYYGHWPLGLFPKANRTSRLLCAVKMSPWSAAAAA